jgi:hypothetical protein
MNGAERFDLRQPAAAISAYEEMALSGFYGFRAQSPQGVVLRGAGAEVFVI